MIRPATPADSDALTRISFAAKGYWQYPEAYFDIWKYELTVSTEYIRANDVFVCEEEKSPKGYYAVVILKNDIEISGITLEKGTWLDHMFVDPLFIGTGIGTRLFRHLKKRCLSRKIHEIGILADPNSRGFYEKMGCTYIREYPSTIAGRTTPYLRYEVNAGVV